MVNYINHITNPHGFFMDAKQKSTEHRLAHYNTSNAGNASPLKSASIAPPPVET